MGDQRIIGDDLTRIARKKSEDLIFDLRKVDDGAVYGDNMAVIVDHQIFGLVAVPGRCGQGAVQGRTAQGGADSGHQLGGAEGLGDIIVGAGVQRLHLLFFLGSGRDDDDRQIAPLSDIADHVDAVHVGKAQIQQDQIRAPGSRQRQAVCGAACGSDFVVLGAQRGGDKVADIAFVFNQQDLMLQIHGVPPSLGSVK